MIPFEIRHLFPSSYEDSLALQLELLKLRAKNRIPDTLILTEHLPVFTAGRAATPESFPKDSEIPIVTISRGGQVTYHGPGQVVGYWLRKLERNNRDLHAHLRLIEQTLMEAIQTLGIAANRNEGLTGVWVGPKKVASIGVAVRSWVTFHGFALNVNVDPEIYHEFRPCGLSGDVMGDLTQFSTSPLSISDVLPAIEEAFQGIYF